MDLENRSCVSKKQNMHFTKREVVGIFLVLAVALLSLGMWGSFSVSALGATGYASLRTFIWASALAAVFFVGTIVWSHPFLRIAGAFAVFLSGPLFISTLYHAAFCLLAVVFAWWGIRSIQHEAEDHLNFRFFRNVRSGQTLFIFSMALAISSGFFSLQQGATWESLITRFQVSEGTSSIIMGAAGFIYPELRGSSDGAMTVDQFLLSMQEGDGNSSFVQKITASGIASLPSTLMDSFADSSRAAFLAAGHEQLAKLAGRPVQGGERISDVFAATLKGRIVTALAGISPAEHAMPRFVPFLLSVLLFLTLLPIGSLFGLLWIAVAWMLFSVFMMAGWVRIETATREQEVLAD